MSKRLQVLLDEKDLRELRRIARRRHMTLSEWVRQVLRSAGREEPGNDPERKLAVVRASVRHRFPTADIEEMLGQIESGYLSGPGTVKS